MTCSGCPVPQWGLKNYSPGSLALESFTLKHHFMLKLCPAEIHLPEMSLPFNYLGTKFSYSYGKIIQRLAEVTPA